MTHLVKEYLRLYNYNTSTTLNNKRSAFKRTLILFGRFIGLDIFWAAFCLFQIFFVSVLFWNELNMFEPKSSPSFKSQARAEPYPDKFGNQACFEPGMN